MKKKINLNTKYQILQLYYNGASAKALCDDYHIARSTFYKWTKDYPETSIKRARINTGNPVNITRLLSHLKKVETELDFLHRTVTEKMPRKERIKIIDEEYGKESIHLQCEALGISRTTYVNHKYRGKKDDIWYMKREAKYTEMIRSAYETSGRVYGAKKITAILRSKGFPVSNRYVRGIMAKTGLISKNESVFKNHLLAERIMRRSAQSRQPYQPTRPNEVWVSDVTSILAYENYYYVCVFVDLFSRKVVGHSVGKNCSTQLAKRAFINAYNDRHPKKLILHTDNGACYTSYSFNLMLARLGAKHSFSRPGIPHDNAVAEAFFSAMKRETLFVYDYPRSFRELKDRVGVNVKWYNSERLHEHLHYVSPDTFEAEFAKKRKNHKK